jgi:hypothetical protein
MSRNSVEDPISEAQKADEGINYVNSILGFLHRVNMGSAAIFRRYTFFHLRGGGRL